MESRIKRLRPDLNGQPAVAPAQPTTGVPTKGGARGPKGKGKTEVNCLPNPAASSTITRSDAPVIRNVRRGSAAVAVAAFRELGAAALEAELRQGRVAKSWATVG